MTEVPKKRKYGYANVLSGKDIIDVLNDFDERIEAIQKDVVEMKVGETMVKLSVTLDVSKLLEALSLFRPGDAESLQYLAAAVNHSDMINHVNGPVAIACLCRMQAAAEAVRASGFVVDKDLRIVQGCLSDAS